MKLNRNETKWNEMQRREVLKISIFDIRLKLHSLYGGTWDRAWERMSPPHWGRGLGKTCVPSPKNFRILFVKIKCFSAFVTLFWVTEKASRPCLQCPSSFFLQRFSTRIRMNLILRDHYSHCVLTSTLNTFFCFRPTVVINVCL